MPIFEYRCSKCGKTFEKLVLGRQTEEPVCPACGSKRVNQQISRFSSAGSTSGGSSRACSPGAST